MPGKKINLRLYDIDGCLYHNHQYYPYYAEAESHLSSNNIDHWLIETNQDFLEHEVNDIRENKYDKVICGYGTNRQSKDIDDTNSPKGGTCAPAMPIIQSYLANEVAAEVVLEPFLMADIYTDKPAGESYLAILREKYRDSNQPKEPEHHAVCAFDESKITLLYAHAHRVAALHPEDEIVIDFYDDKDHILFLLKGFFEKNHAWLPKNVVLNLHQYKEGNLSEFIETVGGEVKFNPIKGTGNIDANYDWSIRYLDLNYSWISSSEKVQQRFTRTAKQLEIDYKDKLKKPTERRLRPHLDLNKEEVEEFNGFRARESGKLTSTLQASSYTSADKLKKDGLIPAQFALLPGFRISKESHDEILCILTDYIYARANVNKKGQIVGLDWFGRLKFRSAGLTTVKLQIAYDFLKYAKRTTNYNNLIDMVTDFSESNRIAEEEYKKTYSCFTSSGLNKKLQKIASILAEENKRHLNSSRTQRMVTK